MYPSAVAAEPARALTFGSVCSFNNLTKHSEKSRACWGKVLRLTNLNPVNLNPVIVSA